MKTVCSLFAGIGGIDLGFSQAGFSIAWANEYDVDACKTYVHNFGENSIICGDIKNISVESIPTFDVLVAGFPCQPFSIAGRQKGFSDKRGNLFFEIARIIDEKRPPVVFLENVKNLVDHDDGKTFLVIYNTLVQFGYYVKYKVMNASEYGNIPQNRERIFIVAFKDYDLCNKFKFPEPIPLTTGIWDIIDKTKRKSDYYYYDNDPYFNVLDAAIDDSDAIYKFTDYGVRKSKGSLFPTLTANMGTFPNRIPIIKDVFSIRKIMPSECLALQGFPPTFSYPKDIPIEKAYKQAGNTVCVPIVKRIAKELEKIMDGG